jgi:hypothetical protein
MPEEVVQPQDINVKMLKDLFDAAFMNTNYSIEGHLMLNEGFACWVRPSDNGNLIQLMGHFTFNDKEITLKRLEFANRINMQFNFIRALIAPGAIDLEAFIFVHGGITKKNIFLATKAFISTVPLAFQHCNTDNILQ